tara:strand:- start:1044 stop:1286 length:243 start_codon:yes stop_codon:yes gene_type:complete
MLLQESLSLFSSSKKVVPYLPEVIKNFKKKISLIRIGGASLEFSSLVYLFLVDFVLRINYSYQEIWRKRIGLAVSETLET